ncbi:MAG: hypothetical protein KF708_24290 [Pirellulales bacterium]|nr:hypothetical protein [Pirellulales bacterium]
MALVSVAARRLRASLAEQIAGHGLGESEFALLWACYRPASDRLEAEGLTQIELSQLLELSPASVSGLVEDLRRAGLLAGARSTVDRRRQVWHLSEQGDALIRRLLEELSVWAATLDQTCDATQRESLAEALQRLLEVDSPARSAAAPTGDVRRGVAA